MNNYYILRYDDDGTYSYIGRNNTTLESVRTDILEFLEIEVSPSKLTNKETWRLEHLLPEMKATLWKSETRFDEVEILLSTRQQKKLTMVHPEVEDEFFAKDKGDSEQNG